MPYRDSKLTRILQDSLGGNARTGLVVNISPEAVNTYETISSLRFGQGASLVKNAPRVNLVDLTVNDLRKLLSERDADIVQLRAQLAASVIVAVASPQKKTEWMRISTPQKGKTDVNQNAKESCCKTVHSFSKPSTAPTQRRYSWFCCGFLGCFLMMLLIVIAGCITNPGNNEERFRRFLQAQCAHPALHQMAETFRLVKVEVRDIGFACLGWEGPRCFIGAFDRWIELPRILQDPQTPGLFGRIDLQTLGLVPTG